MITYEQYITRLIEWTENYLEYVSARIEFDDMLSYGATLEEAFEAVKALRTEV